MALRTAAARPDRVGAIASFHGGGLFTDKPTSPHLALPRIPKTDGATLYFGHAVKDHSMPAEAIEKNWDMTESAARASLAKTTPGTYTAESFLDNDGVSNNPVHIGVRVVVTPEHMTIDFSDVANQVAGSLNSGYYGGATNVGRIAFKCLTTPQLPSNEGCFRPLTIICPDSG